MNINNIPALALCFLACLGAFGFGGFFIPGAWYEGLNRAPWNPPNIVFPIVWLILYIMIALAGWRIFSHPGKHNSQIKTLWITQLIVNALWSWIFFGQHWVLVGLIDLLILDFMVLAIIIIAFKGAQRAVSFLMTPYLLWLSLATSLNVYIVLNN